MKFYLIVLITFLAISLASARYQNLQIRSKDVSGELRNFLEELRKRMCHAIPKFGIPALDPLYIKQFEYGINQNIVKMDFKVQDVKSNGLSDFVIHKFNFPIQLNKFDMNISIPKAEMKGKYKLNGTISGGLLHLDGQGDISVIAEHFGVALAAKIPMVGGRLKMQITQIEPYMENMKFNIQNLFPDEELNELINGMINKFGIEIAGDLFNQSKDKVIEVSEMIGNDMLSDLTMDDLVKIAEQLSNIFDESDPKPDCKK